MHGRVKVKTTAQQEEERRIEREKKLKVYKHAMQTIFDKRQKGEFDKELLQWTFQVLQSNPDDATLWNIRREIFEKFKADETIVLADFVKDELYLTQCALLRNPKSYGAWAHRAWTIDFFPDGDWQQELKLCAAFLEKDERNFLCWDYRRTCSRRLKLKPETEVTFTREKINANFSNYSAWHYRSALLPQLHPPQVKDQVLEEKVLLEEFDLVLNAAFTDPNDQSAFFYHRWLLGRVEPPLEVVQARIDLNRAFLAVQLSHPVKQCPLKCLVDGKSCEVIWNKPSSMAACVWFGNIPDFKSGASVDVIICDETTCSKVSLTDGYYFSESDTTFNPMMSDEKRKVLEYELETCNQLIEVEPEGKWPILTAVQLMHVLNFTRNRDAILNYLTCLMKIDAKRVNYYRDLRSKYEIEAVLAESLARRRQPCADVVLAGKFLSNLRHAPYFFSVERIDLSNNCLTVLSKSWFEQCRFLIELNLDDNEIVSVAGLESLPQIQTLSLCRNRIKDVKCMEILKNCAILATLNVAGNPFCDNAGFESIIFGALPQLKLLDGIKA